MAAPRSSSLRALRILSQQNPATPCPRRNLHITGAQSAQPANVADRTSLYSAQTVPDLKQECQRRSLRAVGSKNELVERLANHDFLQSRAFSIAMRRINGNAFADNSSRQFNTSRSQKAVNDSSTVDFAYMPSMEELHSAAPATGPRIPILPDLYKSPEPALTTPTAATGNYPPMKPQVYTVAGADSDVAASPLSEVVDNHAVDIDPFSLTETVGRSRLGEMLQRQSGYTFRSSRQPGEKGVIGELWSSMMDDMFPKQLRK